MLNEVQDLEQQGYEFEAAEAASICWPARPWAYIRALPCPFSSQCGSRTEGQPVYRGHGEDMRERSGDDTPSCDRRWAGQCLECALRKAVTAVLPNVADMHLAITRCGSSNARRTRARGCVSHRGRDQKDVWGTVGVSEKIIEASWLALTAARITLLQDEEKDSMPTELAKATIRRPPQRGRPLERATIFHARVHDDREPYCISSRPPTGGRLAHGARDHNTLQDVLMLARAGL